MEQPADIRTDPAQECQELMGALSDHVSMLRERAARGDDEAGSVLTTIRDTLYSELMVVRGLEHGSSSGV